MTETDKCLSCRGPGQPPKIRTVKNQGRWFSPATPWAVMRIGMHQFAAPQDHFISNTGMSPVAKTMPLNAIAALMALGEGDPRTRMIVRTVGATPHTSAARK
jgi:hypothetical protein